jgi:hypothetical protein
MRIITAAATVAIVVSAQDVFLDDALTSPTTGWTKVSYTSDDYHIQTPCGDAKSEHYSYSGGVHHFKIHKGDGPWDCSNPPKTNPRSEMSLIPLAYNSGQHQLQAWITVPKGTHNACLQQIFGAQESASAYMMRVFDENGGTLKHYRTEVLASGIYDTEFKYNIIHNTNTHRIKVYINDNLKLDTEDGGFPSIGHWYFKTGVYMQGDGTDNS